MTGDVYSEWLFILNLGRKLAVVSYVHGTDVV